MKLRLQLEMLPIYVIFELKATKNQATTKNISFRSLCRFIASVLTLGPLKRCMYLFRASLVFCNYWALSVPLEAKSNLTGFYTKFWIKQNRFLLSKYIIFFYAANQFFKITDIFSKSHKLSVGWKGSWN